MALETGTRVGVYEVTGKLGEGGMGEVYRAHDTTLDRDVALKVLSEAFTADPDRLARFQREAKVLASLNHPNIGGIYGLEAAGESQALVLELIEGPTLADRIKEGPIPVEEALTMARQIADALEVAHDQGIVHRDLKPANVKVRPDGAVKVLDFGLAKAVTSDGSGPSGSDAPTMSITGATQMGMVVGTAAYMSPEQAKGKAVDKRADVWAFGAVLYEMLTGTRAFPGDDASDTLASVLARDPALEVLPASVPEAVRRLLTRCLTKDPKKRLRDVTEGFVQLEDALAKPEVKVAPVAPPPPLKVWQQPASIGIAVIITAILAGVGAWIVFQSGTTEEDVIRFVVSPDETVPLAFGGFTRDLSISSDGMQIVYKGPSVSGGPTQLNVHRIDQLTGGAVRGGGGGQGPFFSPDGELIGFTDLSNTVINKVSTFGGPALLVGESPGPVIGASWGLDDQIIFGTAGGPLYRVSGGGGTPEAITSTEEGSFHTWPFIIPNEEKVLFVNTTGGLPLAVGQIFVLDLVSGETTSLGIAGVSPHYVPTGHIVYAVSDGSVLTVPFDVSTLEVTGNPVPLVENVQVKPSGAAAFDISDNGRLVYATSSGGTTGSRTMVWVDREGREEVTQALPRNYQYPRLSPDDDRVAVSIQDEELDLWVWSFPGETLSRLTFDPTLDFFGHWSPDGNQIFFTSLRSGRGNVYSRNADGTGAVERVSESETNHFLNAITPDGENLIVSEFGEKMGDVARLNVGSAVSDLEPVISTEFNEYNVSLSPDGGWLAYQSNASGREEVYVRPFPDVEGGRWQVSTLGGQDPLWSRDGTELFYWQGNQMMAVPVGTGSAFVAGVPEMLFSGNYYTDLSRTYDVASDGRFLLIKGDGQSGSSLSPSMTVVLNWVDELQERAPSR